MSSKSAARLALYALAGAAAVFFFHRDMLLSGLRLMPGDDGDLSVLECTRVIVCLLEHWHRVFQGAWAWSEPPFFHPFPNALGLCEAFFLMAVPFHLARAAGADVFSAYQGVLVLMSALGYAGMLLLLRRGVGLPPAFCALGAALLVILESLHYGDSMMLVTHLLPWVAWLALTCARGGPRARLCGAAAAALWPLILFTSAYVGWFSVFFAGLLGLAAAAQEAAVAGPGAAARRAGAFLRPRSAGLLALSALALAALAPFLLTYLPAARALRDFYPPSTAFCPGPLDLVSQTPHNLVWGGLLHYSSHPVLLFGYPPGLWAVFLLSLGAALRRAAPEEEGRRALTLLLGGCVLAALALMVRVGGHSAWSLVYRLVPGASALQSVSRYQVVLAIPVLITAMTGLSRAWLAASSYSPGARAAGRAAVALVCAFLLLEQVDTRSWARVEKAAERAFLASVPPPPSACRSFYLAAPPHWAGSGYLLTTDAMLVALRHGLPTLQGFTGLNPPGWDLGDPREPGHARKVGLWRKSRGLAKGVCELDRGSLRWRLLSSNP